MTLVDNVLIQPNAIGNDDLKHFNNLVLKARMSDSLVSNVETESDSTEWIVNKSIRDTQEVELSRQAVAIADRVLASSIATYINNFYGAEVRDWERVQVLHYGIGGHYIPHVDADTLYKDDLGLDWWEKTLDRDLSVVYFLNDDFTGGELVFPDLALTIRPTAGTLVCFPSDHNYVHGVNPVSTGHRYTLVTWLRVKGMASLDDINQASLDEHDRARPSQSVQLPRVMRRR